MPLRPTRLLLYKTEPLDVSFIITATVIRIGANKIISAVETKMSKERFRKKSIFLPATDCSNT